MNILTLASMAITGSLLATIQLGSIPYTVALSPATVAYQQSAIAGVSSVTQSPFTPSVTPYRSAGSPIILGGSGTRLFLKPELPSVIQRLPGHAIARAELRVSVAQRAASSTSGNVMFGSYQIQHNWSQGGGSSFSAPSASSSPFATASLFYDALPNRNPGFTQTLSFDVTWLVREWVNGAPNNGILIRELSAGQTSN